MNTLLLPLAVMVTTALGQIMFAQSPPPQVSGSWLIDVRTLCAVGGVVLLGTWRIGRWMKISSGRSKPATGGHFKTGQSEVRDS